MHVGTLPGVEKVFVVTPVPLGVRLELSSEMVAYCVAVVPEPCEFKSRLTYARAALLGAAALVP